MHYKLVSWLKVFAGCVMTISSSSGSKLSLFIETSQIRGFTMLSETAEIVEQVDRSLSMFKNIPLTHLTSCFQTLQTAMYRFIFTVFLVSN